MEKQLKPNKVAFMVSRIFIKVFVLLILVIGVFIAFKFIGPEMSLGIYLLPAFIVLSLLIYGLETVVYKKRSYTIYDNKIVQKGGTLFTDYETELNIKNITHLKLRLPFLENKLFNTGHLNIESAGSSSSEIHICSILEHKEIHELVIDVMKKNGFNLDKSELVTTEKPDSVGVFFEVFKSILVGLAFIFYTVRGAIYNDDGSKNEAVYNKIMEYIVPIVAIIAIILALVYIFKFLDLKKRVYKVYKHVITYKEGFLSKNYSLLPFENLTDSEASQTLVDKIFGLYDVKVSCQGSSHEILFKNIRNGRNMSDKLDALIESKIISKTAKKSEVTQQNSIDNKTISQDKTFGEQTVHQKMLDGGVRYDQSYTKQIKIDFNKTIKLPLMLIVIPVVLFVVALFLSNTFNIFAGMLLFFSVLLIVALLIVTLFQYIRFRSTTFQVEKNSVQYKYNFLSSSEVKFNADKVTGVVVSRSFVDEWFNTMSVGFWSIGASSSLNFSSIKKEKDLVKKITSKFGMREEDEIFNLNPKFSLKEFLKAGLPFYITLLVVLFVLAVFFFLFSPILAALLILAVLVLLTLVFLYRKECYKRTKLIFYKDIVYYQKGWLFKKFYYVKYRDIKDIVTVRYPLSDEGKIVFNVSGEQIIKNANNKYMVTSKGVSNTTIVSNSFTMDYILDIRDKDELIDYVLYKRPNKNEIKALSTNTNYKNISKPKITVKPSLKNAMFSSVLLLVVLNLVAIVVLVGTAVPTSILTVLILAMLLFDVLILLPVYLPIRMTTYIMDEYRVLSKRGVIYKKQTSVIYNKIDFINNKQGVLNKLFKNGNITVNTVGSSNAELSIKDIPQHLDFYKQLKDKYENE